MRGTTTAAIPLCPWPHGAFHHTHRMGHCVLLITGTPLQSMTFVEHSYKTQICPTLFPSQEVHLGASSHSVCHLSCSPVLPVCVHLAKVLHMDLCNSLPLAISYPDKVKMKLTAQHFVTWKIALCCVLQATLEQGCNAAAVYLQLVSQNHL